MAGLRFGYMMAHPEANLTDAERKELAQGLDRTLKRTESMN